MKLKDIAIEANKIEDELEISLDAVLHKATQEFGEFNDAIQKYRGIYCKTSYETTTEIEGEIGDLIFNISSALYRIGIDPDNMIQYANNTLSKFNERKKLYKSTQK